MRKSRIEIISMESCRLFIIAMHRSGASLLAYWLEECGLDIGIRRTARFADKDFLEFHELLLQYNETTMYTGIGRALNYDKYLYSKAKSILFLKNIISDQWGVKQPRATLFLDLWRKVNSAETYYISVIRDFWEVVSSLYSLEIQKVKDRNPDQIIRRRKLHELDLRKHEFHNLYLSMWIRYNEEILNHYELTQNGNHIVLWMGKLISSDKALFNYITDEWNFELSYVPISDIYQPELMHELSETEFDFDPVLQERAIETEKKLKAIAEKSKKFLS